MNPICSICCEPNVHNRLCARYCSAVSFMCFDTCVSLCLRLLFSPVNLLLPLSLCRTCAAMAAAINWLCTRPMIFAVRHMTSCIWSAQNWGTQVAVEGKIVIVCRNYRMPSLADMPVCWALQKYPPKFIGPYLISFLLLFDIAMGHLSACCCPVGAGLKAQAL